MRNQSEYALVIADEEEYFATLVAGDVEGIVGDLHEVGIGDTLKEHGTPFIAAVRTSERSKRKAAAIADFVDTKHGAANAIGMDSACAAITGKGEHNGPLYLYHPSIHHSSLRVVVMCKFPATVKGQGLFIAGGPQQNGKSDQEFAFHTHADYSL